MIARVRLLLSGLLLGPLLACSTAAPRGDLILRRVGDRHQPPRPELSSGALIEVKVHAAPELDRRQRVAADGAIELPLCGRLRAAQLTPTELADRIRGCLSAYHRDPQVVVRRLDDPFAVVLLGDLQGQVRWGGGELTLSGALLQLGGEGIGKELESVIVHRGERFARLQGEELLVEGYYLEPGDRVTVRCKRSPCPRPAAPFAEAKPPRPFVPPAPVGEAHARVAPLPPELPRLLGAPAAAVLTSPPVLQRAGLAARDLTAREDQGSVSVEVRAPSSGEAVARCTALLLAAEQELADRAKLASAEARPATTLLATVSAELALARRRALELAATYGEAHPARRAAATELRSLEGWVERLRAAERSASQALASETAAPRQRRRWPRAAELARVRAVLALLKDASRDPLDDLIASLSPALQAGAVEEYRAARELDRLLQRYLERHPEVIAARARLTLVRRELERRRALELQRLTRLAGAIERGGEPRPEHRAPPEPPPLEAFELRVLEPCSASRGGR